MRSRVLVCLGGAIAAVVLFPLSAPAADGSVLWDTGDGNTKITSANGYDRSPAVAPDGSGGLIVAWEQEINLDPSNRRIDLRVQRHDKEGNPLWNPTGGGLLRFMNDSGLPALLGDGSGGAYIAWWESTSGSYLGPYTLLAQRLSPTSGGSLWSTPTAVSAPIGGGPTLYQPQLVPDGFGGALIAFRERLAQLNADGTLGPPGVGGLQVGTTGTENIQIASRGNAITYATWVESGTDNIRVQRIGPGLPWGAAKLVSNRYPGPPVIAPDGNFGALVAWTGSENQVTQVHVQRVDPNGNMLWTADGVVIADSATLGGDASNWSLFAGTPALTNDGSGGAILAWADPRSAAPGINDPDVFAQRVDSSGAIQWLTGGILLPPYIVGQTAPGTQSGVQIVPDGRGGAVVTCTDRGGWSDDISATRVSGDGVKLFATWVFSDSYSAGDPGQDQFDPLIVHDAFGPLPSGPIIAYIENDASTEWDIYANKVELSDAAPANDECTGATTLAVDGAGVWANTGHAAIDDTVAPFCGTSVSGPGVWYRVTGNGTTLTASTCNPATDYDTKLNVYCGSCNDLVCVAGNDDQLGTDAACSISSTAGANRASTVSWCSAPGVEYRLLVQGWGGAAGPFHLTVTSGAACGNPIDCGAGCPGDLDGSGGVGFTDLTTLLANWGPCNPPPAICPADLDSSGDVGFTDLTTLLGVWGTCP